MKKIIVLLISIFSCVSFLQAQIVPTSEWISYWSDSTKINNDFIPVGTVINAYDPDGILCGQFVSTALGSYGLMPVYRDDPATPVDEGAQPGDTITFTVNDKPTVIKGGAAVWTANGSVKKINLLVEEPQIGINLWNISFGSVPLYSTVNRILEIKNKGLKHLNVDSVILQYHYPEYLSLSSTHASLNPGESINITVTFSPRLGSGNVESEISIYSNATDSSQKIIPVAAFIKPNVVSTNEWVNFWSDSVLFEGNPVQPGDVIDVFDPQGFHCGTFTVKAEGKYGLMNAYGDDIITNERDEGASPGDTLSFTINGYKAMPKGPGIPVWISNGMVMKLNLESFISNRSPLIAYPINNLVINEDSSLYDFADLDDIFYDQDGDSLLFYVMNDQPPITVELNSKHKLSIIPQKNWYGKGNITLSSSDGKDSAQYTFSVTVVSVNDPPEPFMLLAPANRTVLDSVNTTPVFQWSASADHADGDSVYYELTYALDSLLSKSVVKKTIADTFYTVPSLQALLKHKRYFWRVRAIDIGAQSTFATGTDISVWRFDIGFVTSVKIYPELVPESFSLRQNYPNPFNPSTTFRFNIPMRSNVKITIINTLGQTITVVLDELRETGYHEVQWNAINISSGVYLYRFEAEPVANSTHRFIQTGKALFMK